MTNAFVQKLRDPTEPFTWHDREETAFEIELIESQRDEARRQLVNAKAYVEKAIASFNGDPADNNFQRGFLAAMEVVRDEAFIDEERK